MANKLSEAVAGLIKPTVPSPGPTQSIRGNNRTPGLYTPFLCGGCGEPCPFPTQPFEGLRFEQDPNELMVTCGCGMTHKLTRASGQVSELPKGATCDKDWRAKKAAQERKDREKEFAGMAADRDALVKAGKCVSCKQVLPVSTQGNK